MTDDLEEKQKCPNCKVEISQLDYTKDVVEMCFVFVMDGQLEDAFNVAKGDMREEIGQSDYMCPKCGAVVARSREAAERFFRGDLKGLPVNRDTLELDQ